MGLIDKVKVIKETVTENFEEYSIIKDMSATEIAKRYGYSKFLSYVRLNLIFNNEISQEVNETDENSEEKENNSILLKFNRDKTGRLIICHEEFGEKEAYDFNILKFMLKKDNIDITIGKVDEDEYLRLEALPQKVSLEGKIEEIYNNKNEYFDALKDKANSAKNAAKQTTKKLINIAADWANENL